MTITELTSKLKVEFEEYTKEYIQPEYNHYSDLADGFTSGYFNDIYQAISFLNSVNTTDVTELIYEMTRFYGDESLVMDWINDPQKLASAIIGYVVKSYFVSMPQG